MRALGQMMASLLGLGGAAEGRRAMRLFALLTLTPAALMLAGLIEGGWVARLALVWMALVVWLLDRLIPIAAPHVPDADEFPAAEGLSTLLGLIHLGLFAALVHGLAGPDLSLGARIALGLAFGLWAGQVSNSNAHELIHRQDRRLRALGLAVYVSVGYGHHASAHRLVHHVHVATPMDPNTARRGEGFWQFARRAWPAEFMAGLRAESRRRQGGRGGGLHPYLVQLGGTAAVVLLAFALGGWVGVLIWALISVHVQLQLMLSDYVQHYGLHRARRADGRFEPVGPGHSWDAAQWASSALMLNAPRHADHHAHPGRIYPALELPDQGLRLPRSLPVMALIAMVPPLWFRMMDPRLPPAGDQPAG